MPPQYEARYISFSHGGRCEGLKCVKAYVLARPLRENGPQIMWEVRCLIEGLSIEKPGFYMHRWYKRVGASPILDQLIGACGGSLEDWLPGQKQGVAVGLAEDEVQGLFKEVVGSTAHVLIHLLDWSHRLRGDVRERAQQLGSDFIGRLLGKRSEDAPTDMLALPSVEPQRCADMTPDESTCVHCAGHGALFAGSNPLHVCKVFDHLLSCGQARKKCCLLEEYTYRMVVDLASCIDELVSAPAMWGSEPPRDSAARGPTKRKRIDEDCATGVVQACARSKRFRSALAPQRSGEWDVSRQRAQAQASMTMHKYIVGSRSAFDGKVQVHMAVDESNFGGEGTLLMCFVEPTSQIACWGVPQALAAHVCTSLADSGRKSTKCNETLQFAGRRPATCQQTSAIASICGPTVQFWFLRVGAARRVRTCPEVIPALMRLQVAESADGTEPLEQAVDDLCEFAGCQGAEDSKSTTQEAGKARKDTKVASYQLMRGYDHALSLLGVPLSTFAPCSVRPRLLGPGEFRF